MPLSHMLCFYLVWICCVYFRCKNASIFVLATAGVGDSASSSMATHPLRPGGDMSEIPFPVVGAAQCCLSFAFRPPQGRMSLHPSDRLHCRKHVNLRTVQVSVHDGVIQSWSSATMRWILGARGTQVALMYPRHRDALKAMAHELAVSRMVGPHEGVQPYLGLYIDSCGTRLQDSVAMVMPKVQETMDGYIYHDGGDVASSRMLPEQRAEVVMQICQILEHLREAGVVLLDLQGCNLGTSSDMCSDWSMQVLSIKHAYPVGHVFTTDDVFKLGSVYTAPPVKAGDVAQAGMDVWALGVLVWELVAGFKPVAGLARDGRKGGQHSHDIALKRHWLYSADLETDAITHDTLSMTLMPDLSMRPSPSNVHGWMANLRAMATSDLYVEVASAMAEGGDLHDQHEPADMTDSQNMRREETLAVCLAHAAEANNAALLSMYHADRIGPALSSLVVTSPKAVRLYSGPDFMAATPRWRRLGRRARRKVQEMPVVAVALVVSSKK